MPKIVGDLGGLSMMTWLTTAYLLTSTTIVPIAGKLADLLGRRIVYVSGLIIFILASALCGNYQQHDGIDYLPWTAGHRRRHHDADGDDCHR